MSEAIVKAEPGDAIISTATGRILLNVKGKLQLFKEGSEGPKIGTKYEDAPVGPIGEGGVIDPNHTTFVIVTVNRKVS